MIMAEFYAFAGEHYVLSWFALWLLWGVIWLAAIVLGFARVSVTRLYRVIMVSLRGWPPAHLDADGDWKPAPGKDSSSSS